MSARAPQNSLRVVGSWLVVRMTTAHYDTLTCPFCALSDSKTKTSTLFYFRVFLRLHCTLIPLLPWTIRYNSTIVSQYRYYSIEARTNCASTKGKRGWCASRCEETEVSRKKIHPLSRSLKRQQQKTRLQGRDNTKHVIFVSCQHRPPLIRKIDLEKGFKFLLFETKKRKRLLVRSKRRFFESFKVSVPFFLRIVASSLGSIIHSSFLALAQLSLSSFLRYTPYWIRNKLTTSRYKTRDLW